MTSITGIYETVLYGEDLEALENFYAGVLGLRRVSGESHRSRALRVGPSQMLLLFRASETLKPHPLVPSHGSTGPGHLALSVEPGKLEAWREKLVAAGFPIEREVDWPTGARSIYVRDPAGNSTELVEGQIWPK